MIARYCYGCYRDLAMASGQRHTVGGFLVCSGGCVRAGLLRWWAGDKYITPEERAIDPDDLSTMRGTDR